MTEDFVAVPGSTEEPDLHKRGVRLLWLVMAAGLVVLVYNMANPQSPASKPVANPAPFAGTAADTISRAALQPTSLRLTELDLGESACLLLGWAVSKEGHVWLWEQQEVVDDCEPSVLDVRVTRLAGGWKVSAKGPVRVWGTDKEWASKGWVKAAKVEVVK